MDGHAARDPSRRAASTLPYSKFAHAVYRYSALVQNAIEVQEEERTAQSA